MTDQLTPTAPDLSLGQRSLCMSSAHWGVLAKLHPAQCTSTLNSRRDCPMLFLIARAKKLQSSPRPCPARRRRQSRPIRSIVSFRGSAPRMILQPHLLFTDQLVEPPPQLCDATEFLAYAVDVFEGSIVGVHRSHELFKVLRVSAVLLCPAQGFSAQMTVFERLACSENMGWGGNDHSRPQCR